MLKINIVLPQQQKTEFTGGALCLMNYAQGLAELGHAVNVVALHASAPPEWFPKPWAFTFIAPGLGRLLKDALSESLLAGAAVTGSVVRGQFRMNRKAREQAQRAIGATGAVLGQRGGYGMLLGAGVDNLRRTLPDADVTVATSFGTAYPVALAGKGRLFYFAQHYEPLFWKESFGGEVSRREAELSYGLGLRMIANSPWLASVLSDKHGLASVPVCAGAIRQDTFVGEPKPRRRSDELHVISYGGRNAEWKGFREMAEGMKLARARNPRFKFRWSVYGNVLLPPDNSIAPYDALGFLDQRSLAKAYGEHDALLSASWYESFPLFPLEAMASGLATIATRIGAEAYAEDGKTVHVVEPRSPEAIASALERLAVDEPYRFSLATAGKQQALEFTWPKAIARMNDILQRPD